jgi:histidyl-tRNA synthetase
VTKPSALPGFRDFYPDEMAQRRHIEKAWRTVAERYGFQEYDGPPLEPLELYIEKSGPEIVNQLFNFTDKGGREVALRPEMTPTLVRMLGARIKGMPRPIRWYSTPQLFRYEKQQRGRLREHFQLNMDIIGEDSVYADVDLLCAAIDVQRELGLTADDVVARVSDRRLLQQALLEFGVSEEKLPVAYNVIDKLDREPRTTSLQRLQELGLSASRAEEVLGLTALSLEQLRSRFSANREMNAALDRLDEYFRALDALGFRDFVLFDMRIVRGLAYYTGIVFELFDRRGALRALCGGGRYDSLFSALAGIDIPALGFGMGDVVQGELLKERDLALDSTPRVDALVIPVDDSTRVAAMKIVAELRRAGKSTQFPYKLSGVGKTLKAAAAAGVRHAIVVGPDEVAAGTLMVRDLDSGTEQTMTLREFLHGRSNS